MAHGVRADDVGPIQRAESRAVLLTFATVSWQKGSAAQVVSLVNELRKVRTDLRFLLLSHCADIDGGPARNLGIEIVDPGFPLEARRNRRSLSMLVRRLRCAADGLLRRKMPSWRIGSPDPVAEAYARADFVIDLSGDSYRDSPGGFAFAHHANFLAALALRTPYALVSQSLGPFHALNKPMVRYFLRQAALVYIRERRTQEILVRMGVPTDQLQLAPDLAFALEAASAEGIWAAEKIDPDRIVRPWVALSMSHLALRLADSNHHRENPYLEEMARLSAHVHERFGGSVFLVPHEINPSYYGPDDRSAAEALYLQTGRPLWMHSIQGDYGPSCLKGFIGQCDALVASRMHAAIAGLSSGVPTLLVAWSHKYRGVMEEIELKECVWDQNDRSSMPLSHLFDQLWARKEPVRARLLEYTARAKKEIAEMAERIAICIPGPALGGSPRRGPLVNGSQVT